MQNRSYLKRLLTLCLCIGWAFLLPHCSKEGKAPSPALAPGFTLKTLDGQEITLSKLKGKVVLLDFWATWCAPCREAIPHLIHLQKTYQEKGFEVIGMNVDRGGAETVRRFVNSMDIPYPIILTPEEVSRNYGVTGLPTTILIDKEGKIRQKFSGFTSEISKQITSTIVELIQEKS
jgi:cytochrome c biogenesis protein CcmG/thiol:disulfide interchange protein DsbE